MHRNIPEYTGVIQSITLILRTQGVRGLYRGLTVSLLKAAPAINRCCLVVVEAWNQTTTAQNALLRIAAIGRPGFVEFIGRQLAVVIGVRRLK